MEGIVFTHVYTYVNVLLRTRDCAFEKRIVDEHMQAFMNVLRWHVCA